MCGLGRPEGPRRPTFMMPRRKGSGVLPDDPGPGFVIRDFPEGSGVFGRVIAAVQRPIWPLVRPHACPDFTRYRSGLTAPEHIERREWLSRWKLGAVVAVVAAAIGALVTKLLS